MRAWGEGTYSPPTLLETIHYKLLEVTHGKTQVGGSQHVAPGQQHQTSWELRKANPQAHPTPTESETLEVGPSNL